MKKLPKWLIILLSVVGSIVLLLGVVLLVYQIQCGDITGTERRVMKICAEEDSALKNLKYANHLKTENNGYRDYSYYDVVTNSGSNYIVVIRDGKSGMEFQSKRSYSDIINRYIILNDLVKYYNSDLGSFSDKVEDTSDKIKDMAGRFG